MPELRTGQINVPEPCTRNATLAACPIPAKVQVMQAYAEAEASNSLYMS